MHYKHASLYSTIFIFILFVDRITKFCALQFFDVAHVVNSFLSFYLVFNRGIMGGFLCFQSYFFWLITGLIMGVYGFLIRYTKQRLKDEAFILGEILVLAGGLSNIIDRFYYQGVIDFVLVSYKTWNFPIFNVADIAIVIGIACMFFSNVVRP